MMRASDFRLEASFHHLAIYRGLAKRQGRLTVPLGPWRYVDDFSSPRWLTDSYASHSLRWAGYVPGLTVTRDGQRGELLYHLQSADGAALGPLTLEVGGEFIPRGYITASAGSEPGQWQPLFTLDDREPTANVSLSPIFASRSSVYVKLELWVSRDPQRYPTNMEYVQMRYVAFTRQ